MEFPYERGWQEEQSGDHEHGDDATSRIEDILLDATTFHGLLVPEIRDWRALKYQEQCTHDGPKTRERLQWTD
jgi:hypothetical protein